MFAARDSGKTDCVVVGAGVVGLAVARALARAGREVVVLERRTRFGEETSARNSGVIHAGLYYAQDSLKARHCVAGRVQLYPYCAAHGIPHRRCGKLVVSADAAQQGALEALHQRALDNGVHDTVMLDGRQARRMEPALQATAALWSPSSGIIDAHALMLALLGEAEDAGALLVTRARVEQIVPGGRGFDVSLTEPERTTLRCRMVVNAAGLHAVALAHSIEGIDVATLPRLHLAKGSYFALRGRAPFDRLVYPLPEPGGLGIHLTLDLAGRARFGPDVEWLPDNDADAVDLAVDPARAAAFTPAIRRWWPGLPEHGLMPDTAGLRPKLAGAGSDTDFRIDGRAVHGLPGLVNLFGIESPGLTAALSIADAVAEELRNAG